MHSDNDNDKNNNLSDREIVELYVKEWHNKPLTKERMKEIDRMSAYELTNMFFDYQAESEAVRNYIAAAIISKPIKAQGKWNGFAKVDDY